MKKPALQEITEKNISYYFDAVQKERLSLEGAMSRHSDWLRLKEKLLSLPQDAYDECFVSIEGLVEAKIKKSKENNEKAKKIKEEQRDAEALVSATLK